MNRLSIALIIFLFAFACSRDKYDTLDSYVVGEIVNFDLNCETSFKISNASLAIKHGLVQRGQFL